MLRIYGGYLLVKSWYCFACAYFNRWSAYTIATYSSGKPISEIVSENLLTDSFRDGVQ